MKDLVECMVKIYLSIENASYMFMNQENFVILGTTESNRHGIEGYACLKLFGLIKMYTFSGLQHKKLKNCRVINKLTKKIK